MFKYSILQHGIDTGIIITAKDEDEAWKQVKFTGLKKRGNNLNLLEI